MTDPVDIAAMQQTIADLEAVRDAAIGLVEVLVADTDIPACIGSMAPGEHYLGVLVALLGTESRNSPGMISSDA